MNNCILMAKIIRNPELRYTQDNQTPIANLMVEHQNSQRPEDNYTLRVIGWGNLATEINEKYKEGDQVIIEGRLSMTTYDRPEGFKEKRVELVASRLHRFDASIVSTSEESTESTSSDKVVSFDDHKSKRQEVETDPYIDHPTTSTPSNSPQEPNLDDIPFVRSVDSRTVNLGLLDSYEIESQCPQVGISHNFKFI